MAKQTEIPGTERPRIQEVSDAMELYINKRNERQVLTREEVDAKAALDRVMKKHKLEVYADDSIEVGTVYTVVREVVPETSNVSVKSKSVPPAEDAEHLDEAKKNRRAVERPVQDRGAPVEP